MKILNRAKATDNSGGYIISQSIKFEKDKMFLYSKPSRQWVECDESTRALNFEDMIDSEGTKIFASLSEDGKGGDKLSFDGKEFGNVFIKGGAMQVNDEEDNEISYLNSYNTQIKVTGIKE